MIFISLDSDPPESVKSLNLYLSEIKRDRVIEIYIERELEKCSSLEKKPNDVKKAFVFKENRELITY